MVPPDDGEPGQPGVGLGHPAAVGDGHGVGDVDVPVAGEVRVERDPEQAALALAVHVRQGDAPACG